MNVSGLTHSFGHHSIVKKLRQFSAISILTAGSFMIPIQETAHAVEIPSVYFGVGCFWHVQHEMVEAERKILQREDTDLTSITAYAGGDKGIQKQGSVCYHNIYGKNDYGKRGYAEVVALSIPDDKIEEFTSSYFSLFDKNRDRPDKGDIGSEYRSVLGLPNGIHNVNYEKIQQLAEKERIQLKEGEGNDPDTLGKKGLVWVLDSNKFPAQQAEVYHQFHDGFMLGEQYPEKYNSLVKVMINNEKINPIDCPDIEISNFK